MWCDKSMIDLECSSSLVCDPSGLILSFWGHGISRAHLDLQIMGRLPNEPGRWSIGCINMRTTKGGQVGNYLSRPDRSKYVNSLPHNFIFPCYLTIPNLHSTFSYHAQSLPSCLDSSDWCFLSFFLPPFFLEKVPRLLSQLRWEYNHGKCPPCVRVWF